MSDGTSMTEAQTTQDVDLQNENNDPNVETANLLYGKETPDDTSNQNQGEDEVDTTSQVADQNDENVETGADTENEESEDANNEFELKLSEDSRLTKKDLEEIQGLAKEWGLDKDKAQELLEEREGFVEGLVERSQKQMEEQSEAWRQEVVNDPVLGGNNLKTTVASAHRALKEFGSDQFTEILTETGYGNHPEVLKFLAKVGDVIGSDQLVQGTYGAPKEKSVEEIFYGSN